MDIKILTIVCSILFFFNCISAEIKGIVVKVIDGDTIYVKQFEGEYSGKYKIRLSDIDAPEFSSNCLQPYGYDSKKYLETIVLNKPVVVKFKQIDIYGRIVGTVFIQKKTGDVNNVLNVNHLMLQNGAAWFYQKYSSDDVARKKCQWAKKNKIGLWSFENPINPQIYRKKFKK